MANSLVSQFLGNAIDSATGLARHNTLLSFLNNVSNAHSNGIKIRLPDPLNTFDIYFLFYPSVSTSDPQKKGLLTALTDTAIGAAKKAAKNALNNVTGGIVGSLMNNVDVQKEHDKFTTILSQAVNHSFMEYLAKANLLCGTEDNLIGGMGNVGSPLVIDMTYFVLKMTVPNMKSTDDEVDSVYFGKFPIPGAYVAPDTHQLVLDVLNTKVPVLERIFYPWMREVTLPYWSYASLPYTTATITVDMTSHADVKYIFIGCRPTQINSYAPDQATPSDMSRQVTFTFDYMFINSDLTTTESVTNKLTSIGKSLVSSAVNSLKL